MFLSTDLAILPGDRLKNTPSRSEFQWGHIGEDSNDLSQSTLCTWFGLKSFIKLTSFAVSLISELVMYRCVIKRLLQANSNSGSLYGRLFRFQNVFMIGV